MTQSSQIDPTSMDSHATTPDDFTEIVHEFRTSLNTILMSVELLAKKDAFGTQIDRKYYLQHIRGAVGTMNELLSQNEPKKQDRKEPSSWNSLAQTSALVGSPSVRAERSESTRN